MITKRNVIVTKPVKVKYDHPPVTEFFKSFFTLGGYKARELVYVLCGRCGSKFSLIVKEEQNYAICPACNELNRW